MKKIDRIILSYDFIFSLLLAVAVFCLLPNGISYAAAEKIFLAMITVVSIVFSIFFAALAIIITAGDNEFIQFIASDGTYSEIIWSYKFTLVTLFIALLFSIFLYISVLPLSVYETEGLFFPRIGFAVFAFVSSYALLSTLQSTLASMVFTEFRTRYLSIKNQK